MPRDRKTLAAIVILAIGLAGTIVDPNGVIGVVLFGAAAAALLFLLARPIRRPASPADADTHAGADARPVADDRRRRARYRGPLAAQRDLGSTPIRNREAPVPSRS